MPVSRPAEPPSRPGCTGITTTGPTAPSAVAHPSPAAPTSPSPTPSDVRRRAAGAALGGLLGRGPLGRGREGAAADGPPVQAGQQHPGHRDQPVRLGHVHLGGGCARRRGSPRPPCPRSTPSSGSRGGPAAPAEGSPRGHEPGWTRPTWTPWRRSSICSASVQPARANLLAAYDPTRGRATRPDTLPMLTTPLGAERRSSGSSASVSRTWASKLIAMTR